MMAAEVKQKNGQWQWFWTKLDQHLELKKLRQTAQRKTIVKHLLETERHFDAETLHEVIRKKHKEIGIATIYRTLTLLKEAGLIEQKDFVQGRGLFEVMQPGHHHDHLICVECGKVIEFESKEIEKLQDKIAKNYGFKLKTHRLDLFGVCQDMKCSKTK